MKPGNNFAVRSRRREEAELPPKRSASARRRLRLMALGMAGAIIAVGLLLRNSRPDAPTVAEGDDLVATDSLQLPIEETSAATRIVSVTIPAHLTDEDKFKTILALDDATERKRQLDELLDDWAVRDPARAGEFVLIIEAEELRKESMLRVMQTWGGNDAAAALVWAKDAPFENDYEREVAMSMACTQHAKTDAPEALRLALAYQFDENDHGLLEGLTSRWAEADFPAARDWVLSIPASDRRDRLIESIALVIFERDPVASSQFLVEHVLPGESLDKAVLALMYQMASRNPAWAQQWLEAFPESPLRDRAAADLKAFQNRQTDGASL
jgi:hypothetical protein